MNPERAQRQAARLQQRHVEQLARGPRGPWLTRSITPADYAEVLGCQPGPETAAIHTGHSNNHHSVQVSDVETAWGTVRHLWIRRHDAKPINEWSTLQRIKNELAGPERTAVEVFPAVSQLVDSANMYHLWVLPEGMQLPFTLVKS